MTKNRKRNIVTDKFYAEYISIRDLISSEDNYGFDLPDKDFIKAMCLLNPQQYAPRITRRIQFKKQYNSVGASANRGDLVDPNTGKHYEVKVSIVTAKNNALNLVQIRLFQNIDYYLCVAYDIRNLGNFKTYVFVLTHDEMKAEMKLCKATSAHGTKEAIKPNKNVELRYSLIIEEGNSVFQRWLRQYQRPDFLL